MGSGDLADLGSGLLAGLGGLVASAVWLRSSAALGGLMASAVWLRPAAMVWLASLPADLGSGDLADLGAGDGFEEVAGLSAPAGWAQERHTQA